MKNAEKQLKFWLEQVIIGLELCPWASPVYQRGGLHLALSDVASPERALTEFLRELQGLLQTPGRESTLLAFPQWVLPFPLFYDVVGMWEEELERMALSHDLQLVTFHPEFRFAGLPDESLAHWVNRSPFPICHFLRSADVEKATGQDMERARNLSVKNEQRLGQLSPLERCRLFPWISA